MATKPICIITPTGMICSSSPLKCHQPGDLDCKPNYTSPQDTKTKRVKAKVGETDCTPDEKDLIGTVAELILAANPKQGDSFAIVCSQL